MPRFMNFPCTRCGTDTFHVGLKCNACGTIATLPSTQKVAATARINERLKVDLTLQREVSETQRKVAHEIATNRSMRQSRTTRWKRSHNGAFGTGRQTTSVR